jgi:two-component system, LytTR family, sensor histidine kinase AlgZ
MRLFSRQNRNIWLHISFWCVYLSFHFYQVSVYQRRFEHFDWGRSIALTATQFILTLVIAYTNYFVFMPRFLRHKSWARFVAEFLLFFSLIITLRVHLQRYIIDGYSGREHYFYSSAAIVQMVAVTLFIAIFITMLRFVSDWFAFEARRNEVENEKLTAELNFLKAQINPHFLFNTLNNLYYLAYTRSENTTEVIAKLSQVMRYMIYESNHAKVPLSKEIEYMQNYISLERLRLNNQVPIEFAVTGNPERVNVAPLILITFLENAFKHGVTNATPDAWISIKIVIGDTDLLYTVENSKIAHALTDNGGKSGIGLTNVKRRLDLMYPGRYTLGVDQSDTRYTIHLKLPVD